MEEVYKLNPLERKAIEKGLEDVQDGRVYNSEEADNMIQKWHTNKMDSNIYIGS